MLPVAGEPSRPPRWSSVHIYDYADQDGLISEVIGPVLAEHAESVGRFFFIRHWSGGPHVRLRLQPAPARSLTGLHRDLREYASAHFSGKPAGDFDEAEFLAGQRFWARLEGVAGEPPPLRAHGTADPAEYVPETEKYGGDEGVAIAEDLFWKSSAMAIDLISRTGREDRCDAALLMMTAALRGAGLSRPATAEFFDRYLRHWSHHVRYRDWQDWAGRAERDRTRVAGAETARRRGAAAPRYVTEWADAVGAAVRDLTRRRGREKAESALINYLHTHNNRLGIPPGEEAYLAYLGGRVLRG